MKFTLVLHDIHEVTPDVANALFESTGGDIEFSCCDGEAVVDFDRSGTPRQVIAKAIEQVEQAGLRVARIEAYSDDRQTFQKLNAELIARASQGAHS